MAKSSFLKYPLAAMAFCFSASISDNTPLAQEPSIQNGAVVIMYHRFDEDKYPSTNTSLETLRAHIEELKGGPYNVLSLEDIVDAISNNQPLPDRTIGISIDDAFLSFYEKAWPEFKESNLPVTIFTSTAPVEKSLPGYMSWSQLRELSADSLINIGNHAHQHTHIVDLDAEAQTLSIDKSDQIFRRALGKRPRLFAYPYGEISLQLSNILRAKGFKAAFGQNSGAISRQPDLMQLPRFPFNNRFGTPDRFELAINSLPLPVSAVLPEDLFLTDAHNPPSLGFTISEGIKTREDGTYRGLNCYSSQNEISLQQLGAGRIEVRLSAPYEPGRARVNCTMLGPDGRWRWFGQQYYIPQ
ncbi:polysaccharide deacetylase family protein [Kiloniella antarctica]|uniref:Chitooligosaccharide deacetylase n=1 Tax=Kiloniella antarctica TaxID=1550907 RepID=A0ABW5BH51_9PROT